ncbi:MAG: ATP-binding protein [Bryobacteraceae bacterium]
MLCQRKTTEDEIVDNRPTRKHRMLSSKFTTFTSILLLWVVAIALFWDVRAHSFQLGKAITLCIIVGLVAGAISRFTISALTRPLSLLQEGIISVREGKFERIQVSHTGDEIEDLGHSFNHMIDELTKSHEEIRQHRDLLEERIRQRTEDLEQALRAALSASQAKSEFLANMSHELRTPMNGLLGMMDAVLDSPLDSERRDQLETAQRSAYALLALLNDILDLSKIEAGKMVLERIPFNITTVVSDCVKAHQAKAQQKHIALRFECENGTPGEVFSDPLRIRQIVTNLLSNAVKFTDAGWITVRLSGKTVSGDHLEMKIEVIDTGTGIETDKLATIFDKFTQADGSITRKYGGTGLGLAITRRLSEMLGGEARVESKVGKGSKFTVTIPCEAAQASAVTLSQPLIPSGFASGKVRAAHLLLVEDNLINQKVVLAVLRKYPYRIDIASNGQEAIEKLEQSAGTYDLVLMDVQMPVLDGLETTRLIRRDKRWQTLPIIAMTAHAMNGDRERCLQAGMSGYVSKPVQPTHLLSTIEYHLNTAVHEPAPSTGTPIERSLTDRLMTEESGMVTDLLNVFLQLAPERLDRLEAAASGSDASKLAAEARKIASAAEQLTTPELGACAQRLELAASSGDFESAKRDLERLREEIRALEQFANS